LLNIACSVSDKQPTRDLLVTSYILTN